jgi:hypothetical protein
MDEDDKTRRSRFKGTLLIRLQAGAGRLVLATAALMAPPAGAGAAPARSDSLLERAEAARAQLIQSLPAAERTAARPVELAFWTNILGRRFGWPNWPNWPNAWHNWHNWPNWPNY